MSDDNVPNGFDITVDIDDVSLDSLAEEFDSVTDSRLHSITIGIAPYKEAVTSPRYCGGDHSFLCFLPTRDRHRFT